MSADFLAHWPAEYSFSLFLILGVCLIAAAVPVTIVASIQWRKSREAELDHLLKQEMLARGLSAEDIERVLIAGRVRLGGSDA